MTTLTDTQEALAAEMRTFAERELRYAAQILLPWAQRFADNPYSALDWSMPAFEAAAREYVAKLVLSSLDKGNATPESIKTFALREALSGARHPHRSTSAPANLVAECTTSAWAAFLDGIAWAEK